MGNGYEISVLIVALLVGILAFVICRAFVLWYWRISEGIALLKSIGEKLERIAANTPETKGA
jgi:hypothetical protein